MSAIGIPYIDRDLQNLSVWASEDRDLHSSGSVQLLELRLAPWRTVTGSVQLLEVADCSLALAAQHWPGGISVVTTPPPEHQLLSNQPVGMRARETLLAFQIPRTPEELPTLQLISTT